MKAILIVLAVIVVAAGVYFLAIGGGGTDIAAPDAGATPEGAVESAVESTGEAAQAASEAATEAADDAASAVAGAAETATDSAMDIGTLLSVEGFDADRVRDVIDGSSLGEAEKAALAASLQAAENNPELLENVLEQVRTALAL